MIERDYEEGGYYVCCDNCPKSVQIKQDEFGRAIEALKMRGWKIVKFREASPNIQAEWRHFCPDCRKDIK